MYVGDLYVQPEAAWGKNSASGSAGRCARTVVRRRRKLLLSVLPDRFLEQHDIRSQGFTHQLRYKNYDMIFTTLTTCFYLSVEKAGGVFSG